MTMILSEGHLRYRETINMSVDSIRIAALIMMKVVSNGITRPP
jgi:hypothetical protein